MATKVTDIGTTAEEIDYDREEVQHNRWEKWKTELLNYSPSHYFGVFWSALIMEL
ncbi:hypothetical protein M405DRAFT_826048 [Rhizopogon salebrosus TDB-379]|nr:hypothetical protein M405DRAFT_826048 [Rhizopogon salebrosus TDB-379]